MTYIAAFKCQTGIVMCADTQETTPESYEKQYAEKLYIIEDQSYPLAFGGAGLDEPIEALSQEVRERASKERPTTVAELRSLIKSAIEHVYLHDVPVSAWAKQYRTAECLIAAKPTHDDFAILRVKGKRIYQASEKAIIGYATAPNNALLRRLHRSNLSMQQSVILALYLVAHSKAINEGVGFDTNVAVVTQTGAWLEPRSDILEMEQRFSEITPLVDSLLLAAPDVGITEDKFLDSLKRFQEEVSRLRFEHKQIVGEQLARGNVNWPYEKLPIGCTVIQSFDDSGKRTLSIYSDPDDPQRETRALRLDENGVLQFKITTNIYISEKTYEHLQSCPSANLKDCIQHIGQDC
jgi:20S proteasome alpha/beta subunit